jgi:hypothetical protein
LLPASSPGVRIEADEHLAGVVGKLGECRHGKRHEE